MTEDFVDCCYKCGEKRYAEYKPFRNINVLTYSMGKCKLCNGANQKEDRGVIYAIDWATMCRKVDYFD
jgi:hypothetical protein